MKKIVMVCLGIFFMVLGCTMFVGCQPKHELSQEWTTDQFTHWHACLHCEEKFDLGEHTGGTATCTQKAVCEVCEEEYGNLATHEMGDIDAKTATIDEAGYTAHQKCNNCPYKENYKEIPYLEILNNLTKEYDGQEVTEGDIQLAITDGYQPQVSFSQTPKNVGEYVVTISILETDTNTYVETTQTFNITPKEIEVNKNFEYNGNSTFTTTQDNFTFEVTFSSKNTDATVTNLTITGEDKDNYTFTTNFSITPKPTTGIFSSSSTWINRTGERSFRFALKSENGLIEGDSAEAYIVFESYDINADIKEVYLSGTDAQNYSVTQKQFKIQISLKLTIQNTEGASQNAYVLYGDDKIYSNMQCTTEMTSFSNITTLDTFTITTEDGQTLISSSNPSALLANVVCSATPITDVNGNWIVPNGDDATLTTFVLK